MVVSNLLRVAFVSVLLILSGSAYASHPPCCECGAPDPGDGSCNPNCACADASGKMVCLKGIDDEKLLATFTEGTPGGKQILLPLQDNGTLKKLKGMIGNCGLVKMVPQLVCTDFKPAPGTGRTGQSGK